MGHAILRKGHKGQAEAADAPKHCMHQVSLTGDDLLALSPQGPLKRARHSFRMKPEEKSKADHLKSQQSAPQSPSCPVLILFLLFFTVYFSTLHFL